MLKLCSVVGAATVLGGCAIYHARPLPQQPDLQTRLAPLHLDLDKIHLPGLEPHAFDPAKGLDGTDVAILAVINNPALKSARAAARAGEAQAFVAGMLPGPQLNYSLDHPDHQGPQYVNAYSAGIAYDLSALVEHTAVKSAAHATAKQVDLDLLWQEWQVAQQARLLYVDCVNSDLKVKLLARLQAGLRSRYRAEQNAYAAGNLSTAEHSMNLASLQNVQMLAANAATARNASCTALNETLGLAPTLSLPLVADDHPPQAPSASQITEALAKLPERRPDLLALQYGYQSQDEQVWRAVLAQFPGIGFGVNRGQDTTDVHTVGFSVSLNFPFLGGGAAAVHAAEATRDALWAQYQQRLDEAVSDAHLIRADLQVLDRQLDQAQPDPSDHDRLLQDAHAAYTRGDLTAPAYYDVTLAAINYRLTVLDWRAQRQQLRIALETLLGLPPEDLVHPVGEKQ